MSRLFLFKHLTWHSKTKTSYHVCHKLVGTSAKSKLFLTEQRPPQAKPVHKKGKSENDFFFPPHRRCFARRISKIQNETFLLQTYLLRVSITKHNSTGDRDILLAGGRVHLCTCCDKLPIKTHNVTCSYSHVFNRRTISSGVIFSVGISLQSHLCSEENLKCSAPVLLFPLLSSSAHHAWHFKPFFLFHISGKTKSAQKLSFSHDHSHATCRS